MKYLSRILFLAFAATISLVGCKKDENQIYYTGGTAPVLNSSVTTGTSMTLTEGDKDLTALKLWWTNPNYVFTTGVSSQDVTYSIEIDTTGSNFSNPNKAEVAIAADLSKEITVGDLNNYLVVKMKLKAGVNHDVEVRVKSSLNGAAALYSNVFKYTVMPYAIVKVPLPAGGDLFLVGDATPGGWSNPVPVPTQQFTKIDATTYEITVALTGGGKHYLLLPENGSWSKKYAVPDNTLSGLETGGDFLLYSSGGQDIPGPTLNGNYKITVDFQEGKFKVVKL